MTGTNKLTCCGGTGGIATQGQIYMDTGVIEIRLCLKATARGLYPKFQQEKVEIQLRGKRVTYGMGSGAC